MVPEGWREGCVGDLLHGLESGVSVNGEDREFDSSEFAVLKVSSVSYGTFNPRAAKVISGDQLERAKSHPKQGQIIISRSNTEAFVGASAYIDSDYPNLFLPDKLWQTKPKADANMKWLSYMLASGYARYTLSNLATGTSGSMKNITKGELLSLKLNIPPSSEQKKIAQILSTWDKAINTTEQLLANSQQQKKALMQQLLTGKKRLLDENGVRFSREWEQVKLRDVAECLDNKRVPLNSTTRVNMSGEYPYWGANGIVDYVDDYIFDETIVLLAEDGGNFSEYNSRPIANISYGKSWVNNHAHILKAKTNSTNEWIYYSLVNKNILGFVNGGTRAKLNKSDMLLIPIELPSLKEQKRINIVLSEANREIEILQDKLDALNQEKKALMQQLLTGKRRVKIDEDAA